jgi:hypothetical protein
MPHDDRADRKRRCGAAREGLTTKKPPEGGLFGNGAGEGIRTLDPNLGKVVLYP